MSNTLLVFDIDGTLINTNTSYLTAIKLTAEYFIKNSITDTNVEDIKMLSGFNNDWLAAYALINSKLTKLPAETFSNEICKEEKKDFETIKKVFQNFYLGNKRFTEEYDTNPIVDMEKGLWESETLIFSNEQLNELYKTFGPLKIITGRTAAEAEYSIKHFQIDKFFDQIISVEDITNKSLSKHPELNKHGKDKQNPVLLHKISNIGNFGLIYYIGDGISDMQLPFNARPEINIQGIHLLESFKKDLRIDLMNNAAPYKPYKTLATAKEVFDFLLKD